MIIFGRGEVEDLTFDVKDSKKSEAKDRLFEDRPSRGQGQEWSRPRTTKNTIFLKITVGKFSDFLKCESV